MKKALLTSALAASLIPAAVAEEKPRYKIQLDYPSALTSSNFDARAHIFSGTAGIFDYLNTLLYDDGQVTGLIALIGYGSGTSNIFGLAVTQNDIAVGDRFFLQAKRNVSQRQEGMPIGGSIDARLVGNIWLSFDYHQSRSESLDVDAVGDYLDTITANRSETVEYQGQTYTLWEFDLLRRYQEDAQHLKFSTRNIGLALKCDLLDKENVSIMPSIGGEINFVRRDLRRDLTQSVYNPAFPEAYPNIHRNPIASYRREEERHHTWENDPKAIVPRITIGLDLEFYPTRHIGISAEGKLQYPSRTVHIDNETAVGNLPYDLKLSNKSAYIGLVFRF